MSYVLFAISAYIFMRAFEATFARHRESAWFRRAHTAIGAAVLYTSAAAMLVFYFNGLHLLGFNPK